MLLVDVGVKVAGLTGDRQEVDLQLTMAVNEFNGLAGASPNNCSVRETLSSGEQSVQSS
jgi:hypothetical protein